MDVSILPQGVLQDVTDQGVTPKKNMMVKEEFE